MERNPNETQISATFDTYWETDLDRPFDATETQVLPRLTINN